MSCPYTTRRFLAKSSPGLSRLCPNLGSIYRAGQSGMTAPPMLNSFPMPPRRHREIEIKLRVDDLAALRRKLRALGARLLHRVYEWNILFDTPRQRLRRKGQLLRLRLEYRPGAAKSPIRSLLTCKGPGLPSVSSPLGSHPRAKLPRTGASLSRPRYKVREEAETGVTDPHALADVLSALGLAPSFRYEKYRTTYRLPRLGTLLVELDQTPIGIFLELEGSPRSIDRASRLLGYTPRDYLVSSYAALYYDHCRRHRQPPRHMLFGTLRNPQKKLRRAPFLP
jgi:adenylate cyclase class 2